MKALLYCFLCISLLLFSACKKEYPFYNGTGKKPLYVPLEALHDIKNIASERIQNTGTIFLADTLFFMLEQKKGIHVFSLSDSLNPVNLTFFKIPAISDFTINGNIMYADSWTDLLTIDISDIYEIKLLKRQKDMFSPVLFPPLYNGAFECADITKGAIIGWEDAELKNAKCEVFN